MTKPERMSNSECTNWSSGSDGSGSGLENSGFFRQGNGGLVAAKDPRRDPRRFFRARLCAKHQPQRVGSASGSGLIPALVCRSFPLRLVLRTQPRSFGGGPTPSASLRIVARRRSTCRALAPGAVRGCAPATLPPDNALDGPARLS